MRQTLKNFYNPAAKFVLLIERDVMSESHVGSADVRWCRPAAVSYVPEKVVVRPGENVTVYCVFNDQNLNASAAVWKLNIKQMIPRSQSRAVNQRVRRRPQLHVRSVPCPNLSFFAELPF